MAGIRLYSGESLIGQGLVVCIRNSCTYFRSISPIAQVKKPRRSTTTSAFFDLHSRKSILRNMHKDFRYGLLDTDKFTFNIDRETKSIYNLYLLDYLCPIR